MIKGKERRDGKKVVEEERERQRAVGKQGVGGREVKRSGRERELPS